MQSNSSSNNSPRNISLDKLFNQCKQHNYGATIKSNFNLGLQIEIVKKRRNGRPLVVYSSYWEKNIDKLTQNALDWFNSNLKKNNSHI